MNTTKKQARGWDMDPPELDVPTTREVMKQAGFHVEQEPVQIEMRIEGMKQTEKGTFILTLPAEDFRLVEVPHEEIAAVCARLHEQGFTHSELEEAVEHFTRHLQMLRTAKAIAKRSTLVSMA